METLNFLINGMNLVKWSLSELHILRLTYFIYFIIMDD